MSKREFEIEILMQQTEKIIEKVDKIIKSIDLPTYKDKIPNIGITLNNKMVEIIQILRKYTISINNSSLYRLIKSYLFDLVFRACNLLNDYANLMLKYSPEILYQEYQKVIAQANEILDNYREINDKLFSFGIAKNIQDALNNSIDFYTRNGENGGYDLYKDDPKVISSYNAELAAIGINNPLVNPNINPKDVAYQQIEQIKTMFSTTPIIATALEDTIIDYLHQAENKDTNAIQSIINFNIDQEIIDSIGKYLAYWANINEFHNHKADEDVKKELKFLGLDNIFTEIENNIKSNKYQKYINWRNKIISGTEKKIN